MKQLCDERFRFDYAHRLGRFFVSLDLTPGSTTDGYIHLAAAASLLPNIARVKVADYEQVLALAEHHYRHSHSTYAIDSAKAAVVRLLNSAVDVSMVVGKLDQVSERLSSTALSRLERLSVQVTTDSFAGLIPFLVSLPNLQFLELRLTGDANGTEVALNALLDKYFEEYDEAPVLPSLRSLKLEYPDISNTIICLAELFSSTLKNLELHIRAYQQDFQVAEPEDAASFMAVFPVLTDLTLTGDIDALVAPRASVSDDLFPALRHLSHLPSVVKRYGDRRPDEAKPPRLRRTKTIDSLSLYNLGGPLQQCDPVVTMPTNAVLTAPPLYPNLLMYATASRPGKHSFHERDLGTSLEFLRDWEARAKAQGDTASLFRMASALTRVELERIAHKA